MCPVYLIDKQKDYSEKTIGYDGINDARRKAIQYLKDAKKHSVRVYVAGRREGEYAGDVVHVLGSYVWRSNDHPYTDALPGNYTINPKNGKIGKRW